MEVKKPKVGSGGSLGSSLIILFNIKFGYKLRASNRKLNDFCSAGNKINSIKKGGFYTAYKATLLFCLGYTLLYPKLT
jgi:hypothetical protein